MIGFILSIQKKISIDRGLENLTKDFLKTKWFFICKDSLSCLDTQTAKAQLLSRSNAQQKIKSKL